MSISKAVATALVGAACMTGLSACGGSDSFKISDSAFVDKCKETADKNATNKAYSADICKCAQDKLVAQGLGDKSNDDKSLKPQAAAASIECTREVLAR